MIGTVPAQAWRNFRTDAAGVSAVKFAVVLPVFIILVFGIFEYGQSLRIHNDMDRAASRASRLIMIDNAVPDADVESEVRSFLGGFNQGDLTVAVTTNTVKGRDHRIINLSYPHQISVPMVSSISIILSTTIGVPLSS